MKNYEYNEMNRKLYGPLNQKITSQNYLNLSGSNNLNNSLRTYSNQNNSFQKINNNQIGKKI